jgi:hypothetical protein
MPGAERVAQLVERHLDLEDLDLLDELGRRRDEGDLPREDLLRIRVERDSNWLTDVDLRDVHFVQVDSDDERLQVGDREENSPGVEGGNARSDHVSHLDAALDDDTGHRRRDACVLR